MAATTSRTVRSCIEHLLRGMCDIVVHLHDDLTLEHTCPKLDALLLRFGRRGGTTSFLEYLYEDEDRQTLQSVMRSEADPGSLPPTLHVSMRDAHQRKIPVQLFYSQYVDAMDERFHIIGVLDQSSVGEGQMPPPFGSTAPARVVVHEERLPASRQTSQEALSSVPEESPLSCESVGACTLRQVPDSKLGEVAVWVNPEDEGMPMLQCSMSFATELGGPALREGTRLLSWVKKKRHREALAAAIKERVWELMDAPGSPEKVFHVKFKPPYLAGRSVNVQVTVSVPANYLGDSGSDSEDFCCSDSEDFRCKLTFRHLEAESR